MPPAPLTRAVGLILRDLTDDRERGISQAEVGRRNRGLPGYVSQSTLSRIIAGEKGIDVDQLNALCEMFDVSIVDIIEKAERIVDEGKIPLAIVTELRPRVGRVVEDDDLQEVASTPKYERDDDTDDNYTE